VFLTAIGADEVQIEAAFCAAIRIAREQKSISLATRAEATYGEYRRQSECVRRMSVYLFVKSSATQSTAKIEAQVPTGQKYALVRLGK
jgi:hypothetical protein